MSDRTVVHATFALERDLAATPARVYRAFAEPSEKAAWFQPPAGWATSSEYALDFRVGGEEHLTAIPPDGVAHRYEARYIDIVADTRLVLAYAMYMGENRISASLLTIEMSATPGGSHLVFTEQGAFLDGYDDAGAREEGSEALLDQLTAYVEAG
jgi:uncharacterized protein YndB with AHSA1/START domain